MPLPPHVNLPTGLHSRRGTSFFHYNKGGEIIITQKAQIFMKREATQNQEERPLTALPYSAHAADSA